jgi:hypothetical protein
MKEEVQQGKTLILWELRCFAIALIIIDLGLDKVEVQQGKMLILWELKNTKVISATSSCSYGIIQRRVPFPQ